MKNKKIQKLMIALTIYLAIILAFFALNYMFPSDYDYPGLGFAFIIYAAPLILLCLCLADFIRLISGYKDYQYSFVLHLTILMGGFIAFKLIM